MSDTTEDRLRPDSAEAGFKILLISKDALFARIAKTKLEGWGHSVRLEEDEAAALEWFRLDPIRLAIIDFDMPDGGGERLCHALRNQSRIGYTYLLCYGSGTDKERTILALESGADSYTHKPLHTGELRLRLVHAQRMLAMDDALFQGAGTDLVTGLLSRNAFDRFLSVLYAQAQRAGLSGVLMFVEVANQGTISRRWGYHASHVVDQEVARRLTAVHRGSDFVAKLDDGRFCLLLYNTSSLQAHVVGQRLAEQLENLVVEVDGRHLSPRLLVSMADYPTRSLGADQVIDAAPRTTIAVLGGPEDFDDGYAPRAI